MINREARLSFPAAMLADPVRETIVMALMDGRAYTSKELSYRARVTPQTTSFHLGKLVAAQILVCHRQGRHSYYRIKGNEVAAAIEALARIAPTPSMPSHLERQADPFRFARRCYDHLAGRLGVALAARIEALELVASSGVDYHMTDKGRAFFAGLGLDLAALRRQKRSFLRPCIDCTERRPHVAGAIGAALLDCYLERGWLRQEKARRELFLSPTGRSQLSEAFGLSGESLNPSVPQGEQSVSSL